MQSCREGKKVRSTKEYILNFLQRTLFFLIHEAITAGFATRDTLADNFECFVCGSFLKLLILFFGSRQSTGMLL